MTFHVPACSCVAIPTHSGTVQVDGDPAGADVTVLRYRSQAPINEPGRCDAGSDQLGYDKLRVARDIHMVPLRWNYVRRDISTLRQMYVCPDVQLCI